MYVHMQRYKKFPITQHLYARVKNSENYTETKKLPSYITKESHSLTNEQSKSAVENNLLFEGWVVFHVPSNRFSHHRVLAHQNN